VKGRRAVEAGRAPWPPRSDEAWREEARAHLVPRLWEAFGALRVLVFDADGVLTGGNLLYGPEGEALKEFDSRDGFGLALARAAGLKLALLTGRHSPIAARRCADLGFHAVREGRFDKAAALREILRELDCAPEAALYMGDDLIDLPALDAAGVAVTVPAAPVEVRERCGYVTRAPGGGGAVREIVDLVLKIQGRMGEALLRLAASDAPPTQLDPTTGRSEKP